MSPKLVVYDGEGHKGDTGVERLPTVECREEPTGWNEQPPKENGFLEGNAFGGQGTIAFVHRVLVGVERLVGHVELEDV